VALDLGMQETELFAWLEAALLGSSSPEADGAKVPKLLCRFLHHH